MSHRVLHTEIYFDLHQNLKLKELSKYFQTHFFVKVTRKKQKKKHAYKMANIYFSNFPKFRLIAM